jgi:stage V sporulation protein S
VSKNTNPESLAGAIAGKVREGVRQAITAIGGEAVAVAISAIAIAREYLQDDELDIYCMPKLVHVTKGDSDEEMTAMKIKVAFAAYGDDVTPV